MSKEKITVQDCLDKYYKKGKTTVIENGKVVKFKSEKRNQQMKFTEELLMLIFLIFAIYGLISAAGTCGIIAAGIDPIEQGIRSVVHYSLIFIVSCIGLSAMHWEVDYE